MEDARERDACGRRAVELQRELDAAAGREQVLVAEGVRKDERIATLLRRPTWGQLLLAGLVGVAGASCVEVARGSTTARPVCAVSASASALAAIVQWEW